MSSSLALSRRSRAAQFGPQARAYVESAVHAGGADLEALGGILAAAPPTRALDLGTGGGHVAYLMAGHAAEVVAADLSSEMLAAAAGSLGLSLGEFVRRCALSLGATGATPTGPVLLAA